MCKTPLHSNQPPDEQRLTPTIRPTIKKKARPQSIKELPVQKNKLTVNYSPTKKP